MANLSGTLSINSQGYYGSSDKSQYENLQYAYTISISLPDGVVEKPRAAFFVTDYNAMLNNKVTFCPTALCVSENYASRLDDTNVSITANAGGRTNIYNTSDESLSDTIRRYETVETVYNGTFTEGGGIGGYPGVPGSPFYVYYPSYKYSGDVYQYNNGFDKAYISNISSFPGFYDISKMGRYLNGEDVEPDFPATKDDTPDAGDTFVPDDDLVPSEYNEPAYTPLDVVSGITRYVLTPSDLRGFLDWFWNTLIKEDEPLTLVFDTILSLTTSLGSNINSITMYPFDVSKLVGAAGQVSKDIILGRFNSSLVALTTNNVKPIVDIGGKKITGFANSFLDFESQISLYIPYVGVESLDAGACIGRTVSLKYIFDLTTGTCEVHILIDGVLWRICPAQIGVEIPFSVQNVSAYLQNISSIITRGAVPQSDTSITGQSRATPFSSWFAPQKPMVIQSCGRMLNISDEFKRSNGLLYNGAAKIENLKGFTKCSNAHIDFKQNPTIEEIDEIYSIMNGGFYV